MSNPQEIVPGAAVTLHFSLSLPDGTEAISTFGEEPLRFVMGDQTFQPGMELALYGLKAGDEQTLTLTPEQAYGEPEPGLVHRLPLGDFGDMAPEPGQIMSFALGEAGETMGIIRAVEGEEVVVDFNHPLAGHEVVFRVQILSVESAEPRNEDDLQTGQSPE
ncbi:MAG: peptidylprolyl isomerase [Gammaproteobacteria bacterium]|nr:MAG: peptidylprolyl isomerase [Gammaproteobacteria bacterium]